MTARAKVEAIAVFLAACATVAGCANAGIEIDGAKPDGDVSAQRADAGESRPRSRQPGPRRIVSLIPAVTEILFALGADDRLVGRTQWGVHPPAASEIPNVGDGVRPSLEAVLARKPDLVILYDGEENRASRDRLRTLGVPVLALRHDTLEDLRRNTVTLGEEIGCPDAASALAEHVSEGLANVAAATGDRRRIRVYFNAWPDPPITIGRGSFIDSLLTVAGGTNVFGDFAAASPRVSLEAIIERDPELVLESRRPTELADPSDLEKRHGWEQVPAVSAGRVSGVDGNLVSRLGPRVADAALAIARTLHADLQLQPDGAPVERQACRS